MLIDRVHETRALGHAVEVEALTVLKNKHLVRVWVSSAHRRDVVRVIAVAAEGMNRVRVHPVGRIVRACQGDVEDIVQAQVRLAHDEIAGTQINFEPVHYSDVRCRHSAFSEFGNYSRALY